MNEKRISIGIFEPVDELTGGRAYRRTLHDVLARKFDVRVFNLTEGLAFIPAIRFRRILAQSRIREARDVWILDFYPVAGMSFGRKPGRNICLFLHLYTTEEHDFLGRIFERLFFRNVRKCDRVVAISNFWKAYLSERGISDVRVIRNCIDPAAFRFDSDEVESFKRKHGLAGLPLLYIGNCRRSKGVVEVYESLKDRGYQLVTSGEPDVELPCRNLNLPYREYLLLLKASSVVITMSKFREGWCRTAHEAMLCKTPVVGSGAGGMAELLEGGNQLVCRDVADLPRLVEQAMSERERLGEDGYRFTSAFTIDLFEKEWTSLIEEVMSDSSLL